MTDFDAQLIKLADHLDRVTETAQELASGTEDIKPFLVLSRLCERAEESAQELRSVATPQLAMVIPLRDSDPPLSA